MTAVLSVDLSTSNTVAVLSALGRPPRAVEVDGAASMPEYRGSGRMIGPGMAASP